MSRSDRREVGAFLRSRRAMLRPEDVGLVTYGRRRVSGLRREELAQLAGVSPTYYTRLEQGHAGNVSANVVDSIARALRLTPDEHEHLQRLLSCGSRRPAQPPRLAEARHANVSRLIDLMPQAPALLVDRVTDVLAWNRLGHSLFGAGFPYERPDGEVPRPNLTRWLFLDPGARRLHIDWEVEAERAVASLRLAAGQAPDDEELTHLVGELCVASPFFAQLWSQHPVRQCVRGTKRLSHPAVGDLTLDFEVLHLPASPGLRLITYTAPASSESGRSLELLGSLGLPVRRETSPVSS